MNEVRGLIKNNNAVYIRLYNDVKRAFPRRDSHIPMKFLKDWLKENNATVISIHKLINEFGLLVRDEKEGRKWLRYGSVSAYNRMKKNESQTKGPRIAY
jgi:hypothetical protein